MYREMRIGTAVPSDEQLSAVKHYFIRDRSVTVPYTAGMYELEALDLIHRLFDEGRDTLVMAGGSMFYIDALCKGLGDVPKADPAIREELSARMEQEGLEAMTEELRRLDPAAWEAIDRNNGARVLRALEVRLSSGRSFTEFRVDEPVKRDFEIEKIGLSRPREELYARIAARTKAMIREGLIEEVRSLSEYRSLTALQTVGYRETFEYLDNPETYGGVKALADNIATATRHYAKRQLTWWRRDSDIRWIEI